MSLAEKADCLHQAGLKRRFLHLSDVVVISRPVLTMLDRAYKAIWMRSLSPEPWHTEIYNCRDGGSADGLVAYHLAESDYPVQERERQGDHLCGATRADESKFTPNVQGTLR